MRLPGILLVLLTVFATVAYPRMDEHVANTSDATAGARPAGSDYWRYSDSAPFHEYLVEDVQQFASKDPQETADRVCTALGGQVAYMAAVSAQDTSVAFLCRFSEPDVTMSVDFGELDRIPTP